MPLVYVETEAGKRGEMCNLCLVFTEGELPCRARRR